MRNFPTPKQFIQYVALRSDCCEHAEDIYIEEALDWLRERILERREMLREQIAKEEDAAMGPD